jgi:hypothetical protein
MNSPSMTSYQQSTPPKTASHKHDRLVLGALAVLSAGVFILLIAVAVIIFSSGSKKTFQALWYITTVVPSNLSIPSTYFTLQSTASTLGTVLNNDALFSSTTGVLSIPFAGMWHINFAASMNHGVTVGNASATVDNCFLKIQSVSGTYGTDVMGTDEFSQHSATVECTGAFIAGDQFTIQYGEQYNTSNVLLLQSSGIGHLLLTYVGSGA